MAKKGKELTTIVSIGGALKSSLTKSVRAAKKAFVGLNSGINAAMKGATVATAAMATATAAATVAATRQLYKMGEGWKKASDTIRIGTGATGKQLEALNASMQNVYAQLPNGKEEVASAIADINTLTGAEGQSLENYATAALKASKMLGTDVKTIYTEASKAFNAFNIPADQMAEKLNHLWKVSQSTGAGIDKLAQGAVAGQATFRQLGFSFEQSTALLGQLDKAGVSSSAALAAMKKGVVELAKGGAKDFNKAFTALSEKIKGARTETEAINIAAKVFGARGGGEIAKALRDGRLSAEAFTASLQASGESIDAAYADTANFAERMTPIKHKMELAFKPLADTVFQQVNKLVPIVGGIVEKYLPNITASATALSGKVKELGERFGAWLAGIDYAKVLANISAKIKEVSELVKKWAPVLMRLGKTLLNVMLAVKAISVAVKVWTVAQWALNAALAAPVVAIAAIVAAAWYLYENWDEVCAWVRQAWSDFCTYFQGRFPETYAACVSFLEQVKGYWDTAVTWIEDKWSGFTNYFATEFPGLTQAAQVAWEMIKGGFGVAWEQMKTTATGVIEGLKMAWNVLCTTLSTAWEVACNNVSGILHTLDEVAQGVFALMKGNFGEAGEHFKQVFLTAFETIRKNWDALWNGLKGIAQSVIDSIANLFGPIVDGFNRVLDTVSATWDKVKGAVMGSDVGKAIPAKAAGGFTHGVSICGEDGTEAVISFDPRYRKQNRGYLMTAAKMLGMNAEPTPQKYGTRKSDFCSSFQWRFSETYAACVGFLEQVKGYWDTAVTWIQDKWNEGMTWVTEKIENFKNEFSGLTQAAQVAWEMIKGGFVNAWTQIETTAKVIIEGLKLAWNNLCTIFSTAWDVACNSVKGVMETLDHVIQGIVAALKGNFSEAGEQFKQAFLSAFDMVKKNWESLWDGFKGIAKNTIEAISDIFGPLMDGFNRVLDTVSATWDKVKGAVMGSDVGKAIPAKAAGGFTHGVSTCGEDGTEAVISFDPRYREQNRGYLMTAAEMLGMYAAPAPQRYDTRKSSYNFGGITISPTINVKSSSDGQTLMQQLRACIPQLVDEIEKETAARNLHSYA